jgi:hypothetical protein
MKMLLVLLLAITIKTECHGQILKKLGKDLENDTRWKLRMKANHKMDQALDTILAQPKKIVTKKDKSSEKNSSTEKQQDGEMNASVNSKDDNTQGYVTIGLSAYEIFGSGTIKITGNSVKYGDMKAVQLKITGPSTNETFSAPLNESNQYSKDFTPTKPGNYTITATSSNNKTTQKAILKVIEAGEMNWQENITVTNKALDRLETAIKRAEQSISSKDKAQLEKKMDELRDNAKLLIKFFTDLNEAMPELKGAQLSPNQAKNLSDINDILSQQSLEMKKMNEEEHEPADNTICEYLVMVNEACAAFQTFTNFHGVALKGMIKNIIIDKAVPTAVDYANDKMGSGPIGGGAKKFAAKLAANAQFDAESLGTTMGKAGIGADLAQWICDVLLKSYCSMFSGDVTETYTINYRNKHNEIWHSYTYETKAAVSLRYPKSQTGKVIIMKGNIEGNATKFTFFANPELMDEFEEARGKAKPYPIPIITPLPIPFATSKYDALGFGAVARSEATPCYFNLAVDAEYNQDAGKAKLFLTQDLADFTDKVRYYYCYIWIIMGLPKLDFEDYVVNKVKRTLNTVVKENNELTVTRDAKNNLKITGGATKHIGDKSSAIEHIITYKFDAKTDN